MSHHLPGDGARLGNPGGAGFVPITDADGNLLDWQALVGAGSLSDATYVTIADETLDLPNSVLLSDELSSPTAIGDVAPSTGDFTAIGSNTPGSGEFTTLDASGRITGPYQWDTVLAAAPGAVAIQPSYIFLTNSGGGAVALTLADPATPADDGVVITFIAAEAQAHTVDNSAGSGFNGGGAGSDIGTFGGAVGDGFTIVAYGGVWYVDPSRNLNVTLA